MAFAQDVDTISSNQNPDLNEVSFTAPNIHSERNSKQKSNFVCHKVGRFRHPDCTKYYYCWDNKGYGKKFSCPSKTAFDPVSMLCVPNYGSCGLLPKCDKTKQIMINPVENGTFFECKSVERASNGYNLLCKPCADTRNFDINLGYRQMTVKIGALTLKLSADATPDDIECTKTGLYVDHDDETKYYECAIVSVAEGILKAVHHQCPKFHVFTPVYKKCIPATMHQDMNSLI